MTGRPLVLLDVDGVLNALGHPPPDDWGDWRTGWARAEGRSFAITWSPTVVGEVLGWRAHAELAWLTTWGHDANCSLRDLLQMPCLPVAGTPARPDLRPDGGDDEPHENQVEQDELRRLDEPGLASATAPSRMLAHADLAPAAPDPLTGRWWKFDVVRRIARLQPQRPLVWLDDDLAAERELRDWARTHLDCLLLAPSRLSGLTRDDLDAVQAYLRR